MRRTMRVTALTLFSSLCFIAHASADDRQLSFPGWEDMKLGTEVKPSLRKKCALMPPEADEDVYLCSFDRKGTIVPNLLVATDLQFRIIATSSRGDYGSTRRMAKASRALNAWVDDHWGPPSTVTAYRGPHIEECWQMSTVTVTRHSEAGQAYPEVRINSIAYEDGQERVCPGYEKAKSTPAKAAPIATTSASPVSSPH